MCERHKERLLAAGVDEKQARSQADKFAIEDARFALPNACTTQIMMTMNTRSLYSFFALRDCNLAQWEIRAFAREMYRLVYAVAPHLFANAGPSCLHGACKVVSSTIKHNNRALLCHI